MKSLLEMLFKGFKLSEGACIFVWRAGAYIIQEFQNQ